MRSRLVQGLALLLGVDDTPHRTALAFAIGLFIAFFPLVGIHTGLALAIAFPARYRNDFWTSPSATWRAGATSIRHAGTPHAGHAGCSSRDAKARNALKTRPQPGCPDQQRYEEWEGGDGEVCSSMPPGAYTGVTDWPRAIAHGRARLLRDEWGPVQGMLLMRCQAGKWVRDGAWCARGLRRD